jgi:hypothetical protein
VSLVSAHWRELGPLGDANHDGSIDIFDVNWISAHWTSASATPVSEPSTIALAIMAVIGLVIRRMVGRRLTASVYRRVANY